VQIAERCRHIKGYVQPLGEEDLGLAIDGSFKVAPVINLVLQCTLQPIE
jgi:hypothetical protein